MNGLPIRASIIRSEVSLHSAELSLEHGIRTPHLNALVQILPLLDNLAQRLDMPPSKPRTAPDDSRSEASSTREKFSNVAGLAIVGKGRRVASGLGVASSLRDSANAGAVATTTTTSVVGGAGQDVNAGMQWSSLDSSILYSYRHAYRLNTPSAFSSSYNQIILSRPDIGRLSPTMARRKDQRRQSKEQLTNAVRKHFNGLGIQENEVVVDFLYKVKWQDKNFRMRFAPHRPR